MSVYVAGTGKTSASLNLKSVHVAASSKRKTRTCTECNKTMLISDTEWYHIDNKILFETGRGRWCCIECYIKLYS